MAVCNTNQVTHFSERPRFRQIWFWAIIMGMDALFVYGLIT